MQKSTDLPESNTTADIHVIKQHTHISLFANTEELAHYTYNMKFN